MTDFAQHLKAGREHFSARRFVEAEGCLLLAARARPEHAATCNDLGVALEAQGRPVEAAEWLRKAIHLSPGYLLARCNLGRVLLQCREPAQALAALEEVLCQTHESSDAFAFAGAALERLGRWREAAEHFADAAALSSEFAVARMLDFSPAALRALEGRLVAQGDLQRVPETRVVFGDEAAGGPVVLVACDTAYLRKYGPAFFGSFAALAGEALLHLHLLDPSSDTEAQAVDLLRARSVRSYRISAEEDRRFEAGSLEKVTWYTCARLAHLEGWVRDYGRTVVALDIDKAFQGPVQRVVDATGEAVLGLLLREPPLAPWLDVVANTLVVRPAPDALRYLRLAAAYVESVFEAGQGVWHLDQCALYCTLRLLQLHDRMPAFASVEKASRETFFHVGHSHDERLSDPDYAAWSGVTRPNES